MAAGFFATIFRFIIFFTNFSFVILGALTFNYGLRLHSVAEKTQDMADTDATPMAMMILGGLVFIVAFFGCCGAFRESSCMLRTYAILVVVLLAFQLYFAYRVYQKPDEIKHGLKKNMEHFVKTYSTSNSSAKLMDDMQSSSMCCGVDGPNDYVKFNETVPLSCCEKKGENPPITCNTSIAFQSGCLEQMVETWNENLNILKYVGLFIILFQVVSISIAYCLASNIRRAYDVV